MTPARPTYQFYGRRKGKPLRRHHSGLMHSLLPLHQLDLAAPLQETCPRRWLEIGFGGGEHLAHQASLNPDVTIMGAEAFQNGVAKLLTEIESRKLQNIRIHYGDARDLLDALPDACFERIYLLYPDPWPKERQKKRRFVNSANLAHFHRLLQPQGQFLFASDIADYVSWTREHVQAQALFQENGNPDEPFENWLPTRFEIKARREGRKTAYLSFMR